MNNNRCWEECKYEHSTFVFTEIFGCGEIGKIFVKSYTDCGVNLSKYPLHVFGYKKDLALIPDHDGIVKIVPSFFQSKSPRVVNATFIKQAYKRGHLGTALLWLRVILSSKDSKIIHIDSDTILINDLVSGLGQNLDNGIDLIGPRRPYLANAQKREFEVDARDLVQTCIFGFNKEKIKLTRRKIDLLRMILGVYNPLGRKTLDYFDPISMEILAAGGKVSYLPHDEVGGLDEFGSRRNSLGHLNDFPTLRKIDAGKSFIHFSAVGTGVNVYKNPKHKIPFEYAEYSLDRWALYSSIFLGNNLGRDLSQYDELMKGLLNLINSKNENE